MTDEGCDHGRPMRGCRSCDDAVAAMLAAQAATPRAAKSSRRQIRTWAESYAAFPTAKHVPPATREKLVSLKTRYLTLQPEPRPAAMEYLAKYQAMFSAARLSQATPEELWEFITSKELSEPGRTSAVLRA